jgi:hypothetical protein
MFTVIKNEAAGVARLRAEVVEVQIQSLHDPGRDKNSRTSCTTPKGTT